MKTFLAITLSVIITMTEGKVKDNAENLVTSASTWHGYDSFVNHREGYKGHERLRVPKGYGGYAGYTGYNGYDGHHLHDNHHAHHHGDYIGYGYGASGYYNHGLQGGYPSRIPAGHGYYGRQNSGYNRYSGYW